VSAVAPAPCIGTAWAPRTSRAAFPVTASAFAIAWQQPRADTRSGCSLCLTGKFHDVAPKAPYDATLMRPRASAEADRRTRSDNVQAATRRYTSLACLRPRTIRLTCETAVSGAPRACRRSAPFGRFE
jgi:hypothetical protein